MVCVVRSMCFDAIGRPHSCDDVLSVELPLGVLESMLTDIRTVGYYGM